MSLRISFLRTPNLSSSSLRAIGVYAAGALYIAGFFLMLDAALWSKHRNHSHTHVGFIDWLPLLLASLGMAIINLVEKSRLGSGSGAYSGSGDAWQARVVLFMGFAFLSGGLAAAIVVLVLRYILPGVKVPALNMGISTVASAVCVMASTISLWVAQNLEDEYSYSLQL